MHTYGLCIQIYVHACVHMLACVCLVYECVCVCAYCMCVCCHSFAQTMAVLNPLVKTDEATANDTDLAGPLVFCLLFGGVLLLVREPSSSPSTHTHMCSN